MHFVETMASAAVYENDKLILACCTQLPVLLEIVREEFGSCRFKEFLGIFPKIKRRHYHLPSGSGRKGSWISKPSCGGLVSGRPLSPWEG